jgi:hypothetical protein
MKTLKCPFCEEQPAGFLLADMAEHLETHMRRGLTKQCICGDLVGETRWDFYVHVLGERISLRQGWGWDEIDQMIAHIHNVLHGVK